MKIAMLGAGAMGMLYGGGLSQHNDVWMVDIWKENVDAINNNGIVVSTPAGVDEHYYPKATTNPEEAGHADLIIMFIKTVLTQKALESNKALIGPNTMLLSLQNGLGNDEDIRPFIKAENLFLGTTACGATLLGPGHTFQAGKGITMVGVPQGGDPSRAAKIVETLNTCGFEAQVAENVMQAIWNKLMVNAGLNAPLALLNVRNGFISTEHALDIARHLIDEAAAIAEHEGYTINKEEIIDHYYLHCQVGMNRCSMLQDCDKKNKTEVRRINGAIVERGRRYGIPTPYNEVITKLMLAKEDTFHFE